MRNLRTPGKENRKPLADTANTPRLESKRGEAPPKPERDKSVGRKAKEEMKKQLNFSYFQVIFFYAKVIHIKTDIVVNIDYRKLKLCFLLSVFPL